MKNTIQNIIILTFLFGSCNYVDYDPKENYDLVAADYFKKESDYEEALVGVYDPLQWMYMNILIGDIASDNSFSGGESATDVLGLQQIDDYRHVPKNNVLLDIWKRLYEGINRANYMEENKDKISFSNKKQVYAQMYFLRAYYYFELVKFFGGVPLFTEKRLTATDSGTLKRASKAEVYTQIEKDLKAAIADLPATQKEKGRATKSAAQAFLGKVYLYQNKFNEAADILEKVIGVYSLVTNYKDIFLATGENGVESVFEVQHSNESNWWDWGCMVCSEGNIGIIHNGPRGYSGPDYASGWSFNIPTKKLVNAYESTDTRKNATILDIEVFKTQSAKSDNAVSYTKGYKHTGYFNHKYIPRAGESDAQIELNYKTNYRAIRYADVLLMAAEAYNRKSSPDAAKAKLYLNKVRRRAFGVVDASKDITNSGDDLTRAIWKERQLEFAMEGHRFFDLVRTGQAATQIKGFQVGKHEVFPIPLEEVDISGLKQNKGY